MNRAEAHKYRPPGKCPEDGDGYRLVMTLTDHMDTINAIYDDRKNEICKNCEFFGIWGPWDKKIESNKYCKVNRHAVGFDYKNYGCNKFEPKEKSK